MAKINWNTVAKKVTLLEGGKVSLSVAQVKEVISKVGAYLYINYTWGEIEDGLRRISTKKEKKQSKKKEA